MRRSRPWLRLQRTPVLGDVGSFAVDLEPRQGVLQHMTMEKRTLRAERRAQIHQTRLQREDLVQALHITARHRQQAEFDAALERIGGEAALRSGETDRREERADQNRVRERLGRPIEALAIPIEARERLPERRTRPIELGRHLAKQPRVLQHAQRFLCRAGAKNLEVLLDEARGGRAPDLVAVGLERVANGIVDLKIEPRGDHDGAHHPHGVLEKSHAGVADRSHQAIPQIAQAADVVDDRERGDVVEKRVDGEVSAEGVFLGRAEGIVAVDQAIVRALAGEFRAVIGAGRVFDRVVGGFRVDGQLGGIDLTPECRDLDRLRAELDVREPEAAPDDPAVAEELLDLMRMRRGADVEVLRAPAEQQIANAAADQVRDVMMFVQTVEDLECIGVDVAARDRMIRSRHDGRVRHHPYATIAGVPPSTPLGAGAVVVLTVLLAALTADARYAEAARKTDLLLAARQFYNAGEFDRAIDAATQAAANSTSASSARLVLGRSRLERYRKTTVATDLEEARTDLRAVDPGALDARERLELQIGLAVVLFFEERYGAAAELLDPLVDTSSTLAPDAHERAVDWWATALDRHAQAMDPADRGAVYERVIDRVEQELRRDNTSPAAGYWLAAAARGSGDLDRAWAAACASWVRASLTPARSAALRADLDRLVLQAIIPEKATKSPRDRRQAIASLTADWDAFKEAWSK